MQCAQVATAKRSAPFRQGALPKPLSLNGPGAPGLWDMPQDRKSGIRAGPPPHARCDIAWRSATSKFPQWPSTTTTYSKSKQCIGLTCPTNQLRTRSAKPALTGPLGGIISGMQWDMARVCVDTKQICRRRRGPSTWGGGGGGGRRAPPPGGGVCRPPPRWWSHPPPPP